MRNVIIQNILNTNFQMKTKAESQFKYKTPPSGDSHFSRDLVFLGLIISIEHDSRLFLWFFQRSQKSYFCQDNNSFGESEAKVFCRMLGWPMGKTRPRAPNKKSGLYSTVSCQGDEMHILDCDTNIISQVK